jgi:hypothetical protein
MALLFLGGLMGKEDFESLFKSILFSPLPEQDVSTGTAWEGERRLSTAEMTFTGRTHFLVESIREGSVTFKATTPCDIGTNRIEKRIAMMMGGGEGGMTLKPPSKPQETTTLEFDARRGGARRSQTLLKGYRAALEMGGGEGMMPEMGLEWEMEISCEWKFE